MSWSKTFEELSQSKHDRDSFDCGESELNTFIQTQAAKHMQAGISRTIVLLGTTPLLNQKYPICAFYSVAPSSICRETLPAALSKKLPHYSIPVFLLAQLAVHKEFHGVIPEYGMLIVLSVSGLRCCFARHSIVTLRPSNSAILSLCSTVFANIQCCTGAQVCYRSGVARCAK